MISRTSAFKADKQGSGVARSDENRPTTRRAEMAEQTRKRILSVALDEFTRSAYANVTVADIAAATGVAKGLVFHHFGSKEGLFLEALRVATAELDASHHSDPQLPSGVRIAQRFRGHLSYLAEHRDLALNLILRGDDAGPAVAQAFQSMRWSGIDWISRLLGLDPDHPSVQLTMNTYVNTADDIATRWLQQTEPFGLDEVTQALLEVLVGSLKAATRLDPELDVADAVASLDAALQQEPTPHRQDTAKATHARATR
ncbi:TetR/AcrR family transcriptional regulator [Streptomyces sp. AS58]|uniref:TetR/AcrR family transcriptional regulator n=1 Tax=Streptomyces sp. AS58 TaxID=1519489 RepID=UPI00099DA0B4|nr:TetR/AcrR family transcriptional regulator [Streptomyces sp. AS58]